MPYRIKSITPTDTIAVKDDGTHYREVLLSGDDSQVLHNRYTSSGGYYVDQPPINPGQMIATARRDVTTKVEAPKWVNFIWNLPGRVKSTV